MIGMYILTWHQFLHGPLGVCASAVVIAAVVYAEYLQLLKVVAPCDAMKQINNCQEQCEKDMTVANCMVRMSAQCVSGDTEVY